MLRFGLLLLIACVQVPSRPDGGGPRLAPNPTSLSFATPAGVAQTMALQVVNFGGAALVINDAGSDVPGLSVAGLPVSVDVGAQAQLDVTWLPPDAGSFNGTLSFDDNAGAPGLAVAAIATGGSGGLPKLAAFPEAGGGGAASLGGRGGTVYEVTNLNDSGTGSLRACLEASGPRTCVFVTGGQIDMTRVNITNPNLTIAGQTAPGGGITLHSVSADYMLFIQTHDVVIRYVTIRGPNYPLMIANAAEGHDIILDHLSVSWSAQLLDLLSNTGNPLHSITLQSSLMAEPAASHPVSTGDFIGLADGGAGQTDLDFHHNLFATFGKAAPAMTSRSMRFVNNLVYNWATFASAVNGNVSADFINNIHKRGPLDDGAHALEASDNGTLPGAPSLYLSGNLAPDAQVCWQTTGDSTPETGLCPAAWLRDAGMPQTYFNGAAGYVPIAVDAAAGLEAVLLPAVGNARGLDCSGAWVSRRDAIDARIVDEYRDGGAGALFVPLADGGYPIPPIAPGTACISTAHDGIPDAYAAAHGLSPADAAKGTRDAGNGWTWLDRYLDGF